MTHMTQPSAGPRAIRGLLLGFILSAVNLLGAFLGLLTFGGLGAWTGWQFIGFFGLLEIATGIAFIFGPNVWPLPGVSIGGMLIRLAINIGAFPVVKLLSPAILCRPALGPSPALLGVCLADAAGLDPPRSPGATASAGAPAASSSMRRSNWPETVKG